MTNDFAHRFFENPILSPVDIAPSCLGMKVECLLNPGVFSFQGKKWMLLRVAERPEQKAGLTTFPVISEKGSIEILQFNNNDPDLDLSDPRVISYKGEDYLTTLSHLRLVSSLDGIHFDETEYAPLVGEGIFESYGIEDCRVTLIGERYYLTYSAVSPYGVGIGMRSTENWKEFKHHGMIIPPHNKDGALFDRLMNGKYFMLHRPSSVQIGGNYIWIAESPDLLHWGGHQCVARTRKGKWDSQRIGAGGSPIWTSQGWLEIYHGADEKSRYSLGALLLDLNDPRKVLARSEEPIMEPIADYEKRGFFGNVVFTNGHLVEGDQLTVYYGASDLVICGAQFSIEAILKSL